MPANKSDNINSILIVDDNTELMEMYKSLLQQHTNATILTTEFATKALHLAKEYLFDIIAIDVTMDYHGSPFGGLDLYKDLLDRYGKKSLIAYSQYITDDLLKRYNYSFNFIKKTENSVNFIKNLISEFKELRKSQTCFIAMPFAEKYNNIYRIIKRCTDKCSYKCIRVDQQIFTKSIVEKIFLEIKDSKIIIFISNDKNPNAFYECGYAISKDKEVITVTDYHKNLPFDIRDRNAIEYKDDIKKLEIELEKRIKGITKV